MESYKSACPPHKPNTVSVKRGYFKILHLPAVELLVVPLSIFPSPFPDHSQTLHRHEKMHDSNNDLPGGDCKRRSLMRKEQIFFIQWGALLTVLSCFACGEGWRTNNPAAFITSTHGRQVLEMAQG